MARRRPKPNRRALELLASCRDGCTEATMLAHGFTVPQMVELVCAGFATESAERVVAGGKKIEVATLRITAEGRQALARRSDDILGASFRSRSGSPRFGHAEARTIGHIFRWGKLGNGI